MRDTSIELEEQGEEQNDVGYTFKNAFRLAIQNILTTLNMLGIYYLLLVLITMLNIGWYSLLFLFGLALPIYLCAMKYDKVFEKLEEIVRKAEATE